MRDPGRAVRRDEITRAEPPAACQAPAIASASAASRRAQPIASVSRRRSPRQNRMRQSGKDRKAPRFRGSRAGAPLLTQKKKKQKKEYNKKNCHKAKQEITENYISLAFGL